MNAIHLLKEYERRLVSAGTKLYLGDVLLYASSATNFIYELNGHTLTEAEKETFDGFRLFKDKFEYLDSLSVDMSFEKVDNEVFESNLMLIDADIVKILSHMLENFYRGNASKVAELTDICKNDNVCNAKELNRDVFYSHKVEEFMTIIALGMMPASQWKGKYEATGGYIIVKEDGDVLCYHIYNRNEFREYLYNNTKFDTPSKTKHHFGKIEDVDGKQILKLNLQIRFVK